LLAHAGSGIVGRMSRWSMLGLVAVVAAALALRLPGLERRPLHADEAVQAIKFSDLLEKGTYRYDANEYHGPTLNYATLPFAWLSGEKDRTRLSETTLRLVPVVFGVGLILLLPLLVDGLGRGATLGAGLLTAVSPALVFYSRYYIHETLLVWFTMLLLAAGWRYQQTRRWGWALLAGVALGFMYATKETFVLAVGAMIVAGVVVLAWEHWREDRPVPWRGPVPWRHVALAGGAGLVVALVLYSSFFTNARGPADSWRAYLPWVQRAQGASPHLHPWWFYLERLVWYHRASGPVWTELFVVALAAAGFGCSFGRVGMAAAHTRLARFLSVYAVVLTGSYSVIAYKTPWCLLGFHHALILLAGVGAAALVAQCRTRLLAMAARAVFLAGVVHLGAQAWRAAVPLAADRGNPYVYAQTVPDLLRLVERARAIARVHPQPERFAVQVMAPGGDYWPLPWYLRGFKNVGWWPEVPADPYASLMIVSAKFGADLDEKSNKRWLMVGLFENRPGLFFELYVELELWRRYVETLPRNRDED
jgi:uncharacterized protein (TIGR03663 family)